MRRSYDSQSISHWLFADRIPLVKSLIVANVLTYLAIVLFRANALLELTFNTALAPQRPWTVLTHAIIGSYANVISVLFAGYWLWIAGGSLERSWGTRTYGVYFFIMSAISAAGLFVGSYVSGVPSGTGGLWLPLAGATVAFAMLNPEQQILFFFLIPMKLKYLAIIDAVIVLVAYGRESPVLGIFALAGCAYSLWFVRSARYYAYGGSRTQDRGRVIRTHRRRSIFHALNPMAWIRTARERRRLRKLFERSEDDRDQRWQP